MMAALFAAATGVASCQRTSNFSPEGHKALSSLVDEYMAAWEPQRISEKGMQEISERIFDHGSDFAMVVDATYYPSWAVRSPKIPTLVAQTKAEEKEGTHRTIEDRILPLGRDAAALTRVYRYTFTDQAGKHGHQDSAVTLVFRRSGRDWKIVQYHGSHGQLVYDAGTDVSDK
jgi:ketosteroid isomerase-like protein